MKDTVKAILRNIISPFNKIDSSMAVIDSVSFTGFFIFKNAPSGTYYIQLMHRNTIETWSKSGGESMTGGILKNYDFTTASSQAFGNNMVLKGTKYCIFSGDVNKDGFVNLTDVINIYNDAGMFTTGYKVTDVNGDNISDLADVLIAYNNSTGFVSVVRP